MNGRDAATVVTNLSAQADCMRAWNARKERIANGEPATVDECMRVIEENAGLAKEIASNVQPRNYDSKDLATAVGLLSSAVRMLSAVRREKGRA
jgi:hypothetical protein